MKKILKSRVFLVLVTAIISSSITGVVAYNYNAKDVSYTPSDSNWNVNNVEEALKSLKTGCKGSLHLIGSSPVTTSNSAASTIPVTGKQKFTYDISSYDNYENYTADNFLVVLKGLAPTENVNVGTLTTNYSYVTQTYDATTGILTVNIPKEYYKNIGVLIYFSVYLYE